MMWKAKKKILIWDLVIAMVLQVLGGAFFPVGTAVVYASESMNGSGTKEDPFQISSVEQLSEVANGLDKHYIQVADIEFTEDIEWQPIGSSQYPFKGTFDGNGYKIKNFVLRSELNNVGLFSYINEATFKNVVIEDAYISGGNNVGALAANSTGGTILENCYLYGTVKGAYTVGGLVANFSGGRDVSYIKNCHVDGTVEGSGFTGGLVGYYNATYGIGNIEESGFKGELNGTFEVGGICGATEKGNFLRCYNEGKITGIESSIGGITGSLSEESTIKESYNRGTISGNSCVGGLTGNLNVTSTIIESYNLGRITGANNIGGLVGITDSNCQIVHCFNWADISGTSSETGGLVGYNVANITKSYSTGTISGSTHVGGLVGYNSNGNISYCMSVSEDVKSVSSTAYGRLTGTNYKDSLTNNYAYEDMVVKANYMTKNIKDINPLHTDKQGASMTKSDLSDLSFYTSNLGWDFEEVWKFPESGTDYPILRSMDNAAQKLLPHLGSKRNPYLIYNENDLKDIPEKGMDQSYKLMNDITIQSEEWTTIGSESNPFKGVLDGNRYQIKNLAMNNTARGKGLFGWVYTATIKNLKLVDCELQGTGDYAGGIAAYSLGSDFQNCSVSGSINGKNYVGGIAGYMKHGQIIYCQNDAVISATGSYTGGIAGQSTNYAVIEESSNQAYIKGITYVGGITGYSEANSIIGNTYNSGNITGSGARIGGIVGCTTSKISHSYSTGNISGNNYVGGIYGGSTSGANISYCVAMNDKITSIGNYYGRVGGDKPNITLFQNSGNEDMKVSYAYTLIDVKSQNPKHDTIHGINVDKESVTANDEYLTNLTWDFEHIWMLPEDGNDDPILRNLSNHGASEIIRVTGITLSSVTETMSVGDVFNLTAEVIPADAKNQNVTWKSSDTKVATVSNSGKVTAVNTGTATITVTTVDGGFTAKCVVRIIEKSISVTGVTLDQTSEILSVGNTLSLTVVVSPNNATNKTITWSSSDEAIAIVSDTGVVTAMAPGNATITVKTQDQSYEAFCKIEVPDETKPEMVNLALNKKAASESISGSYVPKNAIDGNESTRWTAKSNTSNVYLSIDFEEEVVMEQIHIKEHDGRINSYKLQYLDGEQWKDFHSGTTIGEEFVLNTDPIICTQIRLFVVSTKGAYGASIFEFEVYGSNLEEPEEPEQPETVVNLALNKKVSASHTSGKNIAQNVADGDKETRWGATNNSAGSTLEIDFGKTVTFNQIKLYEAYNRVESFNLQYFDGSNWNTYYSGTTIGEEYTADFSEVQASKVRLEVTGLKNLYGASIYEFEVYHIKE